MFNRKEWLKKHPNYQKEYKKKRYRNDPLFRQKCIDEAKKWQKKNKKKFKAIAKRYYHKHHDELIVKSREYQNINKEKLRRKWKEKYNTDFVFKNKVKRCVNIWRENNREYYNFYNKMLVKGIKVNKKSWNAGEYERIRKFT